MPEWGFTYRIEIVEQLLNRETCMDSRVLTVPSGKGGVGKTKTTANLGTALAMQGKKPAVLDADIGLPNLEAVLGLGNRIVVDLVDVVAGPCRLPHAVRRGDMMDVTDVLEVLGIDLLGIVPEDEMIIVAINKGEPIVYDKHAQAGRAFVSAAQRIMGEEIPLDEIEDAPTLMERLRRLLGFGPAMERRVRS